MRYIGNKQDYFRSKKENVSLVATSKKILFVYIIFNLVMLFFYYIILGKRTFFYESKKPWIRVCV